MKTTKNNTIKTTENTQTIENQSLNEKELKSIIKHLKRCLQELGGDEVFSNRGETLCKKLSNLIKELSLR